MQDIQVGDSVRFILVIEKDAIFRDLTGVDFTNNETLGKSVLITGKGYPDIATRELVHRLGETLPSTYVGPQVAIFSHADSSQGSDILSGRRRSAWFEHLPNVSRRFFGDEARNGLSRHTRASLARRHRS